MHAYMQCAGHASKFEYTYIKLTVRECIHRSAYIVICNHIPCIAVHVSYITVVALHDYKLNQLYILDETSLDLYN